MEEDSNIRFTGISSGLAVLLSDNKPKSSPQKSRLISYCDGIGDHSVERTLEHIFDLPHKSVRPTSLIDINFIRSILRSQIPRFQQENAVDRQRDGLSIFNCDSSPRTVVIDSSSVCGDMKTIRNPLIVESQTVFSSARANACVWKGKWMYEVTLETSGIQQLGWAIISCPFTDRKGVGDSDDSYAFDGRRVSKWNKDPMPYGQSWVVGDVIGCCIDLDNNEISFFRNGVSLGVAFDRIQKMNPENGYYPAISLSDGERCDLNFGARPFKYPISGFLPFQTPPISRDYANYLLSCLTRLLGVQCLDKPGSAYFEKLRRLKRFAPLKELFYPISHGIMEELFDVVNSSEGSFEYFAWGAIPSFFLGIFGVQEAHDRASLDQVLELFLEFPGSDSLLQHLIRALSYGCKVAPLVLTECPYSGSYPYLALVCYILRHRAMMVLWWKSPDFEFSFEGFLSLKRPNKQDLHCLIPSVWWPGSCEDVGCESSMMLTMTALSTAIDKIEEKHRELCSLVIQFVPPAIPKELPGSVFRAFLQGFILKVRGTENKMTTSIVSNNSAVLSLYTVILHFLSEGFKVEGLSGSMKGIGLNLESDVGFLHRTGKRRFPLELFFVGDGNCAGVRRIGGGFSNHLFDSQFNEEKAKVVQWDEGGMDDEDTRITHSTMKKPCCCSDSVNDVETSKHGIMLTSGGFKGLCAPAPVRSTQVVAMFNSSNHDAGIVDKPSTSNQPEAYSGCLQHSESRTSFNEHSLDVLREEELLHMMLFLYHLGVASNFRQAFYYMSHQSQSISLLDDTDKQIREKSCIEQVKRLKEARNAYREELVDCVRQCAWYRISLFSRWKQRGMYATCMWVVELLLVLSNSDTCFCYVPEFYLESLVDTFHALRKSDPPFVASAIFLKQGLASFVTFVVRHFNDPRILSADIKDLLLHSISSLVQCKDYLIAFENNKEAIHSLPKALLLAFDNRSWIPVTNIILRLCKGSGFGASKHLESSSTVHFQVLLREACCSDETLFSSFLNRLFNTLSWTMTEFSVSIREMQENCQFGDLQQRRCSVVFDLSCSLARLLEFCTREIPQAFLLGPDMNLRRLIELIIFILNHIISASDAEFFDMSVRRPSQYQEKTNRTMILAPLVGIITSLMDAHSDSEHKDLNDVVGVFSSMDCPATVFQCLLGYNWSTVLRGDASPSKLRKLEEFSSNLRRRTETAEHGVIGNNEDENCCCICYSCDSDSMFEPCHHVSCHGCITRHLLNGQRCFFCNAVVTNVIKLEPSLGS